MTKRNAITLFLLAALAVATWAQSPVRVMSVTYEIDGRTMLSRLEEKAALPEGSEFASAEDFEAELARLKQRLLNERVLETVDISWTYGQPGPDGVVPADVQVSVKDTWNIIGLPYFKYDSNTGLLLSIRGRDYNFLGSMLPLRLNLNYEQDTAGQVVWGADLDFSYPFSMWNLDWNLSVGASLGYHANGTNPSYGVGLGLGSSVELGPGVLDFGLSQGFTGNGRASDGYDLDDPFYMTSALNAGWSYVLGTSTDGRDIVVRPRAGVSSNWAFGGLKDDELQNGPALNTGVGLSWGSVDWIENFRDGETLSLDASATWWPVTSGLSRVVSASGALYRQFEWLGMSMKGSFFYSFDGDVDYAGSALRGILNSRAYTDTAFTFNIDLPVRVIRFLPSQWFGKEWMRYFEFEQHWSPFIDISQGHYDGSYFLVSDGWYAGGLEVITYPLAMRSFYVRISLGWDLLGVAQLRSLSGSSPRDGSSIWELFLGMGLHY